MVISSSGSSSQRIVDPPAAKIFKFDQYLKVQLQSLLLNMKGPLPKSELMFSPAITHSRTTESSKSIGEFKGGFGALAPSSVRVRPVDFIFYRLPTSENIFDMDALFLCSMNAKFFIQRRLEKPGKRRTGEQEDAAIVRGILLAMYIIVQERAQTKRYPSNFT
ncbi:hypothetical protein TIFTF001_012898 [Ficus carica]|uniref:Uncharacterized protein n=1 Tax=Ficus carica TaxID=3494 RepID=A0AA87ZZV7_FICCA|nr:hypothetical protein TIFTF001_012898 [Ficus carica]